MYFDPLTAWIVSLLANGVIVAGQHTSNADVRNYYKDQVRKSNVNLNAQLRNKLNNIYSDPERVLENVKRIMQYYKNRYEYKYGDVVLELDVQDLMIKLYKDCILKNEKTAARILESYEKYKNEGCPEENLQKIIKRSNEYTLKANSYREVLEVIKKQRNEKAEQERKEQEYRRKNPNSLVILKSFIVIALCVIAFMICLSGDLGKLGMGICMLGAALVGYSILKGTKVE